MIASHFLRAHWRWNNLRGGALAAFQERRARQIVAFADRHSPFYHSHWGDRDRRAWRELPEVDKRLMMEQFDNFNTRGITRELAFDVAQQAEVSRDFRPTLDSITVGLSSGTSGHRGLFLVSRAEQAAWAGTILARTLHEVPRQRLRVAFFLRSNSNLYEHVAGRAIQFGYFDLMAPLEQSIAALNRLHPSIVVGPPSLLGLLADAADHNELASRPSRLIAVAEVLEPQDQARLQATFDAPVDQIYQCTEGLLAISCRAGRLHIQEDIVALQLEPLPNATGDSLSVTPIITDLWRKTQPIIRYRLNDVLRIDPQPCPCGSDWRVIAAIDGRVDDVCWFDDCAGGRRPFFPDTLRRMVLLASDDILDYLVVQETSGTLRVHLTIPASATFAQVAADVQASIVTTFAQYGCRPPRVLIEAGLPPLMPGTKRRRVVCTVPLEHR